MESVNRGIDLVKLDNMSFSYPGHHVFQNVCATIPAGMVILQGNESTGKTTLVKLIAGQLSASSGVIRYRSLSSLAAESLTKEQYFLVGEDADEWELRTPLEFFDHCQSRYGAIDTLFLEELVDAFGLKEHVGKNLYKLSRGSKRKVWLAAAFAVAAPITLMDDPFIALDRQSVVLLKELINDAAHWTDKTLIITQHVPDAELHPTHLIDLNKVHS